MEITIADTQIRHDVTDDRGWEKKTATSALQEIKKQSCRRVRGIMKFHENPVKPVSVFYSLKWARGISLELWERTGEIFMHYVYTITLRLSGIPERSRLFWIK